MDLALQVVGALTVSSIIVLTVVSAILYWLDIR